jgi:DNA-binding beta-propeller fold protein YncE
MIANIRRIAVTLIVIVIAVLGLALIYLVYPGTPSRSKVLAFDGYVELPRRGALTILDYLTLRDHTLYVTSESSGAVFRVALDSGQRAAGTVSEMPGGGAAHGVAFLPGQDVAFVTRSEENTVDVFNPHSLVRLGRIRVADDVDAILYVPSAQLIYAANGSAKVATLIDPVRRAIVGVIKLHGTPEFPALDPATGLLYQNLEDIDSIAAIDLGQRSVVGQWSLAPCDGPSGMAIDAEHRRLFAVCSKNARLVVFDLDTHRVITSLAIGGGPDVVAFDRTLHRIYSAGKAGQLTVIQQDGPDAYRVADVIRTHFGAHTLAVDSASHKVFVAYASLFAHPRIAVFSPQE